jgi:ABC transporter substrate binding protein
MAGARGRIGGAQSRCHRRPNDTGGLGGKAGNEHDPDRHRQRDRSGWSGSGEKPRPAWRQCYRAGIATTRNQRESSVAAQGSCSYLSRVAVLWNAANPAFTPVWRAVDATARSMGLVLLSQPVREAQDFAAAFAAIVSQRPEGFLVLVDALVAQHLRQIVEFTVRERLAAVSTLREFAALGGLMSYGTNLTATQRKAAGYVDRVLKGENPAELPFEQPTTFELVINLKAAKALGLTVPQLMLARADEVSRNLAAHQSIRPPNDRPPIPLKNSAVTGRAQDRFVLPLFFAMIECYAWI